MELNQVLGRRRMVRSFDPQRPLDEGLLTSMLRRALRAPSAGNSQGTHFVVLVGGDTSVFWDASLPAERREGFAFPGLLDAPAIVVPVAESGAYLARYSESDKGGALGRSRQAWNIPYWLTDTAFATMVLLLEAVDEGLGACFFGLFGREAVVREALAIPDEMEPLGAVAIGHPAPGSQRPGRSAARPRRRDVIHRGGW